MIYLRRFNDSKEKSIKAICQKYGIINYTINEDGSIDVNSDVYLTFRELKKIPLKFRNVTGNFFCRYNQLTTLEGAPRTVGGIFACSNNQLKSLEGAPQTVGGNFGCGHNQLTTLEGAPTSVGGDFCCYNNQLVNLEFAPSCQWLYCEDNPIHKWWKKVDDTSKLSAFIDLGIDTRDPDFMNAEKINLLNE